MADKTTPTYLGARCRVARGRSRQGQSEGEDRPHHGERTLSAVHRERRLITEARLYADTAKGRDSIDGLPVYPSAGS
jgi:hypothetical protein